jgi:hypothetical protein
MPLRAAILRTVLLGLGLFATSYSGAQERVYRRGDANGNGSIDISDAVYVLNFLFNGGPAPDCVPIANANGSGGLDISDGIAILSYLFGGLDSLPPLTEEEIELCESPPVTPTVIRHGSFLNVSEPSHSISGRVEELSDGTIRITNFFYDGEGVPHVVVFLQEVGWGDTLGCVISEDLLRTTPYAGESMTYTIPKGDSKCDAFRYVTIYCDFFPQPYAYTRMVDGPFP